jgi:hypothetical protein
VAYSSDYYWVVICKNHRFHHKSNTSYEHRIILGEADQFTAPPMLTDQLKVRCDNCGEEYSYQQKDVLRAEMDFPPTFAAHPLFK